MTDLPFLLQFQCDLIGTASLILFEDLPILSMHQIKIKILHPACPELLFKQRTDLILLCKEMGGQLIGKNISVPGITGCQSFPQSKFTFSAQVTVCGIEVIESGVKKCIHHLTELRHIHFSIYHWQAHTAKPEFSVNLREELILHRSTSPFGTIFIETAYDLSKLLKTMPPTTSAIPNSPIPVTFSR